MRQAQRAALADARWRGQPVRVELQQLAVAAVVIDVDIALLQRAQREHQLVAGDAQRGPLQRHVQPPAGRLRLHHPRKLASHIPRRLRAWRSTRRQRCLGHCRRRSRRGLVGGRGRAQPPGGAACGRQQGEQPDRQPPALLQPTLFGRRSRRGRGDGRRVCSRGQGVGLRPRRRWRPACRRAGCRGPQPGLMAGQLGLAGGLQRQRRALQADGLLEGLDALRPTIGLDRQGAVQRLQQAIAVAPGGDLGQRLVAVGQHPAHRGRRGLAADREVRHRRQRIQVGPWPLVHAGDVGVLLDRRIAGLQDHRQRLGHVADHLACGAKVQQQRPTAVGQQQHVVGRHVAVVPALGVDHRQGVGHRAQPAQQRGLVGRLAAQAQFVAQGAAFVERHHHVGGAIGLPEAEHLDQRRVVKARQQPGLHHEAVQPLPEGLGLAPGFDQHLQAAVAHGQGGGQVLLERHLALERVVPGAVDDGKAAFAGHRQQLELAEHRAGRQRIARALGRQGLSRCQGHRCGHCGRVLVFWGGAHGRQRGPAGWG